MSDCWIKLLSGFHIWLKSECSISAEVTGRYEGSFWTWIWLIIFDWYTVLSEFWYLYDVQILSSLGDTNMNKEQCIKLKKIYLFTGILHTVVSDTVSQN